ncbi:hypothetical protein HDU77_003364 [Chytriomyces hyalinus]|nr:hypothetical protein HDU77_003364 [Chytriomyces hyalinus]
MFRKQSKTPDAKSGSTSRAVTPLPALPNDSQPSEQPLLISKDEKGHADEPQPVIKSVGLSLQPPTVKPQNAEIHEPDGTPATPNTKMRPESVEGSRNTAESGDGGRIQLHGDSDALDFQRIATPQVGYKPPHENFDDNDEEVDGSFSARQTRLRSISEVHDSKSTKRGTTLSAITEVPSSDERSRPATSVHFGDLKTGAEFQDEVEADDGDEQEVVQKSPKPSSSKAASPAMPPKIKTAMAPIKPTLPSKTQKSPSPQKKVVVSKKKLVQIDSPVKSGAKAASAATVPPKKPEAKALTYSKPAKPALKPPPKPIIKPSKPIQPVASENSESEETSPYVDPEGSLDGEVDSSSHEENGADTNADDADDESLNEKTSVLEEDTNPVSHSSTTRGSSAKPANEHTANPKPQTPKSATKRHPPKSSPEDKQVSEKVKRRLRMKLDNDGFSAMGLASPSDDQVDTPESQPQHKSYNEPPPPAHHPKATAPAKSKKSERPLTAKMPLTHNPASRRLSVKKVLKNSENVQLNNENWLTQPYPSSNMGYYDSPQGFERYAVPGRRCRMPSNTYYQDDMDPYYGYYNQNADPDPAFYEVDNAGMIRVNRVAYEDDFGDYMAPNPPQAYRYSDRIAGKYKAIESSEDLVLSTAAMQAAERDGVISPRTFGNLTQYMDTVEPKTETQEPEDVSPKAKKRNTETNKTANKKTPLSPLRGSIMNDVPEPEPKKLPKKTALKKPAPSGKFTRSIMDDDPPDVPAAKKRTSLRKPSQPDENDAQNKADEPKTIKIVGDRRNIKFMPGRNSENELSNVDGFGQEDVSSMPMHDAYNRPSINPYSQYGPEVGGWAQQRPPSAFYPRPQSRMNPNYHPMNLPYNSNPDPYDPQNFWTHPMMSPYLQGPQMYGMPPHPMQQQLYHPNMPFMNPGDRYPFGLEHNAQGLPIYGHNNQMMLPSIPAALRQPQRPGTRSGVPTVPPNLMPARLKLTQVPVVTFRQSYVIEPTGHPPGTYIPPGEMDPHGGLLTYISAGMYPSEVFGQAVEEDDAGSSDVQDAKVESKLEPKGDAGSKAEKAAPTRVRSMIKKGVIGRR